MSTNTPGPAVGMLCPTCGVALVMTERQSIEIDYCPKCRGIWLDRGELDKIIERSAGQPVSGGQQAPGYSEPVGRDHHGGHGYGYRRKSWLQEIFD